MWVASGKRIVRSLLQRRKNSQHKPEECDILIEAEEQRPRRRRRVGEPIATLVLDSGEVVSGKAAIREALKSFLASTKLSPRPGRSGYFACYAGLECHTTGPDGKPVTVTGNNVEVVRRQPDGTWLFVIDNPRGAD